MADKIELLAPSLLDQYRSTVEAFKALSGRVGIGFGWHYPLDLAWAYHQLPLRRGMTVLDAGAGSGLMQWFLADRGINVLSIDRAERDHLRTDLRKAYNVRRLLPEDLPPLRGPRRPPASRRQRAVRRLQRLALRALGRGPMGRVTFHRADLASLEHVPTASIDHVVSISSLEHNTPDALPTVVTELLRVLKPGGSLVATLGAAADRDWFHEPSSGWCYTEATLRRAFSLDPAAPSNYASYPEIFAAIRDNAELRDNLSPVYFKSGNNGMPWGVWDPKYLSVGVRRDKARN
jgi:ubiquinone/menaquinone biosynthesis C-methylase UbiE